MWLALLVVDSLEGEEYEEVLGWIEDLRIYLGFDTFLFLFLGFFEHSTTWLEHDL